MQVFLRKDFIILKNKTQTANYQIVKKLNCFEIF